LIFGDYVYSSFKEKYPNLILDNILFVLNYFIHEYLLSKDNKEEASQKIIKDYFEKIPNLDDLCDLIKKGNNVERSIYDFTCAKNI